MTAELLTLEPIPLHRLAEFLRDGCWLEMRTDSEKLVRVRITEIRVYKHGEDVVLRQEWLDMDMEFHRRTLTIESEAIWRAWPIKMSIEHVPAPVSEERPTTVEELLPVLLEVIRVVMHMPPDVTVTPGEEYSVDAKHCAVLIVYEMTNESPPKCCTPFGYGSQQPLLTARDKLDRYPQWANDVRSCAKKVRAGLGYEARRNVGPWRTLL